jgi:two-component system nitrate/nitrite response regulator NarL
MRILIVDDHASLRQGIAALLEANEGFQVCGEAENGKEAIEKTLALEPDVVLMDITMPVMGGFDAAQNILSAVPDMRIIFVTMHNSSEILKAVRGSGAKGFVSKTDVSDILIEALNAVFWGQTYFGTAPQQEL